MGTEISLIHLLSLVVEHVGGGVFFSWLLFIYSICTGYTAVDRL